MAEARPLALSVVEHGLREVRLVQVGASESRLSEDGACQPGAEELSVVGLCAAEVCLLEVYVGQLDAVQDGRLGLDTA